MSKQFYTNLTLRIPLLLLLLGIMCKVHLQTLNISKSVANMTTTGDGTTASQGDVLQHSGWLIFMEKKCMRLRNPLQPVITLLI
jgi:hypothetical protein